MLEARIMEITPIGILKTPFVEKFGTPRQSGLVKAQASLILPKNSETAARLKGLDGFSHLWIIFEFSKVEQVKNRVRPPRAGGQVSLGVWATRSPHRPNRLGLSLCRLIEVRGHELIIEGIDALDGTPVYDIKPFVKEDRPKNVKLGWTQAIRTKKVKIIIPRPWSTDLGRQAIKNLREVLKGDPRPASQRSRTKDFGLRLEDTNYRFQASENEKEIVLRAISFNKL